MNDAPMVALLIFVQVAFWALAIYSVVRLVRGKGAEQNRWIVVLCLAIVMAVVGPILAFYFIPL